MSTRYVWEKSEVKYSTNQTFIGQYYSFIYISSSTTAGYVATDIEVTELGKINLSGTVLRLNRQSGSTDDPDLKSAKTYRYFADRQTGNDKYIEPYEDAGTVAFNNLYWTAYNGDVFLTTGKGTDSYLAPGGGLWEKTVVAERGNLLGLASSAAIDSFPNNEQSGGFWYAFKGSDNIDPMSVAYSAEKPERGEAVTVTINPQANSLGGTVSYLYQYSIDGGRSWTSSGNETTDTEKTITVPSNAEQFMVRVRASDNLGFTSADYVSGKNLAVQTMKLWVGVDNKARPGKKLWVGVDGKARPVAAGWVGDDNGKARRWF